MIVLLIFFFGHATAQNLTCEPGWTEYDYQCYKHFNTPNERLLMEGIRAKCATFGGDMATGGTVKERQIMETLNKASFKGVEGEENVPSEALLTGIMGKLPDEIPSNYYIAVHGPLEYNMPWCKFATLYPLPRRCLTLRTFESKPYCFEQISCNGSGAFGFRRYICKAPKKYVKKEVTCSYKNNVVKDGKCVCKDGYVDIRESDPHERRNYKEGERCVPQEPCHSIRKSVSIIFIIDSSQSIQEKNWPSLVDFIQSGARMIPNEVNVGFIKFSTDVTFAEWLPTKWSRRDFQQMVPTEFDAGYTNTPAAIEKAIEMFDEDGSQGKVAVLITDGLPVPNESTDKKKALTDTENAIAKLRRKRIKLVALGFGPELKQQNGYSYMKKWLEDAEEDYFSFDKMACDLKSVHMQILLQKVCRRYV